MAKVAMYVKMIEVLAAAGVIVEDKKAAMKFRSRFEINNENVEEKINGGLIDVILFCRKRMAEWGYASVSDDIIIRAMSQDIGFYMNHWNNPIKTENGQLLNALAEELKKGVEAGEVAVVEKAHKAFNNGLPEVTKTKTGEQFSTVEEMYRQCSVFMPQWDKEKECFEKFRTMPTEVIRHPLCDVGESIPVVNNKGHEQNEATEAEGMRHPLCLPNNFIPLAQPKAIPELGRVSSVIGINVTGNSVAKISSQVAEKASEDKSWFELSEKFPDGKISGMAIALAKTAELQDRRHKAGTYKGIDPLPSDKVVDMLWNPDAKYAFMRNAALGKVTAKPKVNWKDKYDKTDITLRGISLRLWIDRTAKKIPTGFIYVDDNADKPFLRFKWGFRSDGTSHTYPMVERRVPKTDQYELIGNKDQYTDLPAAIRQALEEINIKPGYSNGEVVPGVSITGIIR